MNVINKIKTMGYIPKENKTYDKFLNNVKSHHKYEILSSKKAELYFNEEIHHHIN